MVESKILRRAFNRFYSAIPCIVSVVEQQPHRLCVVGSIPTTWFMENSMLDGFYKSPKGVKYEVCNGQIMVEHDNGYYGCIYGRKSMSIFKDNRQVFHTASRRINTADELYKKLENMPAFMKMLQYQDRGLVCVNFAMEKQ